MQRPLNSFELSGKSLGFTLKKIIHKLLVNDRITASNIELRVKIESTTTEIVFYLQCMF